MSDTDARSLCVGVGYDVHAFAPAEAKRALVLGGVRVPYERGLEGHSDADVLAHALADALLGAARMGDIGEHFPDSDPAYAKLDSMLLLEEVKRRICHAGYRILDADCVVIAQEPKIAPYREQMRARLAEAMRVPVACVGLKATTTEHLGFEGRGEGISAQAVVLLTRGDEHCSC